MLSAATKSWMPSYWESRPHIGDSPAGHFSLAGLNFGEWILASKRAKLVIELADDFVLRHQLPITFSLYLRLAYEHLMQLPAPGSIQSAADPVPLKLQHASAPG